MKKKLRKALVALLLAGVLIVASVFQSFIKVCLEDYAGLSGTAAYLISLVLTLWVLFYFIVEEKKEDNRENM